MSSTASSQEIAQHDWKSRGTFYRELCFLSDPKAQLGEPWNCALPCGRECLLVEEPQPEAIQSPAGFKCFQALASDFTEGCVCNRLSLPFHTALKLPFGKTTVMHLVARETLPEPNSQGKPSLAGASFEPSRQAFIAASM